MKEIKWGILGAASIARGKMIPAILQSEGGAVHAIASRSGKAAQMAEEFNIPFVLSSYEELLEMADIDAVYIATPNSSHTEWIEKALLHGKHVLCEKPIVLRSAELEKIIGLAEEKERLVMEAFMYRFHPQMTMCKKLLEQNAIGDILTIRSRFHFQLEDWENDIRIQPSLGGGVLWDIGCYSVNAILDIVGEEPETVQVVSGRTEQVDTHAAFQLKFPSGKLAIADCSFHSPMLNEIDIIGTRGSLFLPHAFRPDLNEGVGIIRLTTEEGIEEIKIEGDSYVSQVNAFQESIRGRHPLPYTNEQMLSHTLVLEKLIGSL